MVAAESLRERLAERCLDPKDEIRSRAVELIMDAALKSAPCLVSLVWRDGREAHEKLHRSVQPAAGLLIVALCCIVIALSNFCNPP